jgi:hypothetical protein
MRKLLSILSFGILLMTGNPISELKVNKIPTNEEVRELNHSENVYEVFLNSKGNVEYRDYDDRKIKGTKLPFTIKPNSKDLEDKLILSPVFYVFGGQQVNLKVENGWLVGFDRGEWGGNLFWFNEEGTEYKMITGGNIENLFEINGEFYVSEGLAHMSMDSGQLFKLEVKNKEWRIQKKVNLPNAPYSTTLTSDNEFLIVTSKGVLKVNKEFEIETLVEQGFWSIYLHPNSILIKDKNIYIGMRGGILKSQLNEINKQEWLTKK